MRAREALAFVRRHGIVLEGARGPVPTFAEAVAGGPIRGSWWGHAKGKQIFWLTRAVRDSPEVLVCRLVGGRVTYVHRRLWPALVRLARVLVRRNLAALHEVHTPGGRHELQVTPFPHWVPRVVKRQARRLSAADAKLSLGRLVVAEKGQPYGRSTLAGGDRSKGSGVFVLSRARIDVQRPCADGQAARSLGALR